MKTFWAKHEKLAQSINWGTPSGPFVNFQRAEKAENGLESSRSSQWAASIRRSCDSIKLRVKLLNAIASDRFSFDFLLSERDMTVCRKVSNAPNVNSICKLNAFSSASSILQVRFGIHEKKSHKKYLHEFNLSLHGSNLFSIVSSYHALLLAFNNVAMFAGVCQYFHPFCIRHLYVNGSHNGSSFDIFTHIPRRTVSPLH